MSKTNVDLTISVVDAEVENLLRSYPYSPYQQVFAVPSFRQKLVAYVLSRIPSLYAVIEEQEWSTEEPLPCPPAQRQQIETFTHRGIQYLLLKMPKVAIAPPASEEIEEMEEMNVGSTSSHWFR
ncbi:MAG: hypothetical protein HC781_19365 [Leptolyngbyaceae cyanobacterium CSU_1_4]|nr:hypothetical protein [Leptolyngbyaceae cyanobacterium CSU_1_4]